MPDLDNDSPFGAVLRSLREQRGYTLELAAAKSHIYPNYFGDVERGVRKPTLRVAARVPCRSRGYLDRVWCARGPR